MPVDVWVEDHQPVGLAPLRDLHLRRGTVVYVGRRVTLEGQVFDGPQAPGWVVYDGQEGFAPVADPSDAYQDDQLDWGASLGRTLQPGEALHVRFT